MRHPRPPVAAIRGQGGTAQRVRWHFPILRGSGNRQGGESGEISGRTLRGWQEVAAILRSAAAVTCRARVVAAGCCAAVVGWSVIISGRFSAACCLRPGRLRGWSNWSRLRTAICWAGCAGEAASRVFLAGKSTFIAARIGRFEVSRAEASGC